MEKEVYLKPCSYAKISYLYGEDEALGFAIGDFVIVHRIIYRMYIALHIKSQKICSFTIEQLSPANVLTETVYLPEKI